MTIFLPVAMVLLASIALFADEQQTCKPETMREKPFTDAKIVLALKSGQIVDIQKREGSWYFVKVAAKGGWVPMLCIRRSKPAATAAKPATVQTGRSTTGSVVSTTGVRGLDEERLKTAPFSEESVVSAEKFRASSADAAAFAIAGGLTVQPVPTLVSTGKIGDKK